MFERLGNARGRVRATASDQFDALYSGSRINLTDGCIPAGLEALTGNRMSPSYVLPGGFLGAPETDHLDFLQAGWTHESSSAGAWGVFQLRYGYAIGHLDTSTAEIGESRIELLGGAITGPPPLANLAVRPRHQIEGATTTPRRARSVIRAVASNEPRSLNTLTRSPLAMASRDVLPPDQWTVSSITSQHAFTSR